MHWIATHFTWNGEVRPGDVVAFAYLLTTVLIFWTTYRALLLTRRLAFEDTLFKMFGMQRELVRDSRAAVNGAIQVGLELFRHIVQHQQVCHRAEDGAHDVRQGPLHVIIANRTFDDFQDVLGNYFHNLYHVIAHIDRHRGLDRRLYAKMVCAQLSTPELVLVFYHGLTHRGHKLKTVIERYGLLQDLPPDQLIKPEHWNLYALSAYGA